MLSDCQTCKYSESGWCAVNPGYWKVERTLRATLTPGELNVAEGMLLPCPHWEQATVPHSIPVEPPESRYFQSPLRDLNEQQMALLRRKSWQEQLFDAINFVIYFANWIFWACLNTITGKTLFILGVTWLTMSDPQSPVVLAGLPQITDGYAYAQFLCTGIVLYQTSHWRLAVKRGEFASTKQMFNDIRFSLLLLLLMLGLMAWGGMPA